MQTQLRARWVAVVLGGVALASVAGAATQGEEPREAVTKGRYQFHVDRGDKHVFDTATGQFWMQVAGHGDWLLVNPAELAQRANARQAGAEPAAMEAQSVIALVAGAQKDAVRAFAVAREAGLIKPETQRIIEASGGPDTAFRLWREGKLKLPEAPTPEQARQAEISAAAQRLIQLTGGVDAAKQAVEVRGKAE